MLLPQELKKTDFSHSMRGYSTAEVDEYIDLLIAKYEELFRENDKTERKLSIAMQSLDELRAREKKVAELDAAMKKTAAHLLADTEAKQKQILADAEAARERILADARETAARMIAEADRHVAAQESVFLQIQNEVAALRDTLFAAYDSHIDKIEELTAISAGARIDAPAPAVSLYEAGEEIAVETVEVPAATVEVPATTVEVPAATVEVPATTVEVPATTVEIPAEEVLYADLYTDAELADTDPFPVTEETHEDDLFALDEDIYTDAELAEDVLNNVDDLTDIDEKELFTDPDFSESSMLEKTAMEMLARAEAEAKAEAAAAAAAEEENDDAILLRELHDTFVRNFDVPKAEKRRPKKDGEDDIMKALAEAIEEKPQKTFYPGIDSFEFLPETAGTDNDGQK